MFENFQKVGIPVIFDFFHHSLNNNQETFSQSLKLVKRTWKKKDGIPMTDYSSQRKSGRVGAHTESIDLRDFENILKEVKKSKIEIDMMLEIKDKEKSAEMALKILKNNV